MSRRTRSRSNGAKDGSRPSRSSRSSGSSGSGGSGGSSGSSGRGGTKGSGTPDAAVERPLPPAGRAPDGTPYDDLRDLAVGIAQQAAGLVRRLRAEGVEVAGTKTSEVDVVTEADRASEALVLDLLSRLRRDDAVLGEEGTDRPGTSGVRWVVDPIDGTVNFLYGIPEYAVSIAVEVLEPEPHVVAAAVVNIATGSVFEAYLGGGARRDGVPLQVRGPAPLGQRLVRTGFSYDEAQRERQAAALTALLPRVRDVRRIGSCALDLCAVAAGEADGYGEEGTHPWDHAAGLLVAAEAGARWELTPGAGGRPLVLCAPTHGYDELRAAFEDAGFLAASASEAQVASEAVSEAVSESAPDAVSEEPAEAAPVAEAAAAGEPVETPPAASARGE